MTNEYPTLLHQWFDEVWNQKKASTIRELFTEDTVVHGLSGPGEDPVRGFDAFEKFHADFIAAFPDVHIDVDDVVTEGDKLAGRFTVTGTQTGPLAEMPATGKKTLFTGSGICTVKDGKFTEIWNEIDFPKMQYDLAFDTPDIQ
jgi:steroid delta-isomerase-like uncharacterized protein